MERYIDSERFRLSSKLSFVQLEYSYCNDNVQLCILYDVKDKNNKTYGT